MKNIEFYLTPKGGVMISDANGTRQFNESDREFVGQMMEKLSEFYPEALKELSKVFDKKRLNIPHFEYRVVLRFIKCNWGKFDSMMDIDQFGNLNFEEVECPLRGECCHEGVICKPKFNSSLSSREIEVMRCYYDGLEVPEIADKLFLSIETVKTHKRNVFKRTSSHTLAEFICYAKSNNLFQ